MPLDSIEEDGGNAVSENGPVDDSQDVNVHYDDIAEKVSINVAEFLSHAARRKFSSKGGATSGSRFTEILK